MAGAASPGVTIGCPGHQEPDKLNIGMTFMIMTRYFSRCVALATTVVVAVSASAADAANDAKEQELIAVLKSDDSSREIEH